MGYTLHEDTSLVRDLLTRTLRSSAKVLLRLPAPPDPTLRGAWVRLVAFLRALGERAPAELLRLVRPPSVSVLMQCADMAAHQDGDAHRMQEHLRVLGPQLLFELARTRRLPREGLAWPLQISELWSVPGDVRLVLDGCLGARFEPGLVRLELERGIVTVDLSGPAGPAWPVEQPGVRAEAPYPTIMPGAALALHDASPISMNEAHPDKEGNQVSLGGRPVEEWVASLRGCLELVGAHMPALREEMGLLLQQVVPVGYDAERHLSASFKEAIGTIYLTLHPAQLTMVEAVIHELQHNKLNALATHDPLLHNAFWPLVASPVRPDPRPLWGVLLAVHAFLPVAELYRLLCEAGHPLADTRGYRARWRHIVTGNHEGMTTLLANAEPTALGQAVLDELRAIDERHQALVAQWPADS